MITFGNLKNNLKRFQTCNNNMNILMKIQWTKATFDQQWIKKQPLEFYLKIIHYVLVEYSAPLYAAIIKPPINCANLKLLKDKTFVQKTFSISKMMFNLTPEINIMQFLEQGKYTEKKLDFIVNLCQAVFTWANNAKGKQSKYIAEVKTNKPIANFQSEDEDQLEQRVIDIKPTQFIEPLNHSFGRDNNKKKQKEPAFFNQDISSNKTKPNIFPKNLKQQYLEDDVEDDNLIQTSKFPLNKNAQIKSKIPQAINHGVQQQNSQFVTKQQFNDVLEMVMNLNSTINELVAKFSNFQSNVTSWFNNTNARVVLLQQNVKMIKSNL